MDMRSYRWYRATITMNDGEYIREVCYRCPVTFEYVRADMEMSLLLEEFPFGSLTGREIHIMPITSKDITTPSHEWKKVK